VRAEYGLVDLVVHLSLMASSARRSPLEAHPCSSTTRVELEAGVRMWQGWGLYPFPAHSPSASRSPALTRATPPSSTAHTPRRPDHPTETRPRTPTRRARRRHPTRTTPDDPREAIPPTTAASQQLIAITRHEIASHDPGSHRAAKPGAIVEIRATASSGTLMASVTDVVLCASRSRMTSDERFDEGWRNADSSRSTPRSSEATDARRHRPLVEPKVRVCPTGHRNHGRR
jgi:hypothetical protein